jgi:hypothetical protein
LPDGAVIDITAAERIAEYTLRVSFSDGIEQLIDFGPFLRSNPNPLIRAYLSQEKFTSFRVEQGDLVWDDYGLCFAIADLYENRI